MEPAFDLVVLTVANAVQQRFAQRELARRQEQELLPAGCAHLVVPDPRGARVGSGGSTLLVLAQLARRDGAFAGRRVLVIHSGGDSRRLPAFSARGKIWAPMDRGGQGPDRAPALFDIILGELGRIALPAAGGVVVASGDAALRLKDERITRRTRNGSAAAGGLAARGATVMAFPAGFERARRHGVFTLGAGGRVRCALQKPDRAAARAAGAVRRDGTLLVDSGIFHFPPAACTALLQAAGARARDGQARAGSLLADLALGRANLDLYGEIASAMSAREHVDSFLERFAPAETAPRRRAQLRRFFVHAHRVALHAAPLRAGRFLHLGSSREWVERIGSTEPERIFGEWIGASQALMAAPGTLRLRAVEGAPRVIREILLSADCCLAAVPVGARSWCVAPHGIDDDCKTTAQAGGTIAGRPLAALPQRTGVSVRAIWGTHPHTLWHARIFPAGDAARGATAARWILTGSNAPVGWRRMQRLSFADLMHRANADRMADEVARDAAHELAAILALAAPGLARQGKHREAARFYAVAWRTATRAGLTHIAGAGTDRARAHALSEVGHAVSSQPVWPALVKGFGVRPDQAVWASSPVRIDLAGGWTDTPPLCNDHGGTVVNAAITLAGTHPVQAMAKVVEEPAVTIHSVDAGRTQVCRTTAQLLDHHDPRDWAALPKAALILSGLVPRDAAIDLQRHLKRAGGGLAITLFSAVPRGSGLGTSSILGATLLAALGRVAGRLPHAQALAEQASVMEQLISTRGGWQDQVGGLVGGIKITRTRPGLRQSPRVQPIAVPHAALAEQRRMAKDILETVVLRYLSGERSMERARIELTTGAEAMATALRQGDLETFAERLAEYWRLKRVVDPASTNAAIESVIAPVSRHLTTWSLAGAGGGGFALLLARSASAAARVRTALERDPPDPLSRVFPFEVDPGGLRLAVL